MVVSGVRSAALPSGFDSEETDGYFVTTPEVGFLDETVEDSFPDNNTTDDNTEQNMAAELHKIPHGIHKRSARSETYGNLNQQLRGVSRIIQINQQIYFWRYRATLHENICNSNSNISISMLFLFIFYSLGLDAQYSFRVTSLSLDISLFTL